MADIGARLDRLYYGKHSRLLTEGLRGFLHLVMPSDCVACGTPDAVLCPRCRSLLRRATVRPFRAEHQAEALPPALAVLAAGRYRRELAQALLAYKNHGRVRLTPVLAAALADVLRTAAEQWRRAEVLLVPVPGRGRSRRRRGYDPLRELLRYLLRRGLLPPGWRLVRAVGYRYRSPGVHRSLVQKNLGGGARRRNVRHTMRLRGGYGRGRGRGRGGRLDGISCVIVDDVLTTGATIAEVHRVLCAAGAVVSGAVVIAATAAPQAQVLDADSEITANTQEINTPKG